MTYIPPPPPEDEGSIFAHYQTGINFDKYDSILVEVSGHSAPPAILVSVRPLPHVTPVSTEWPTWVLEYGVPSCRSVVKSGRLSPVVPSVSGWEFSTVCVELIATSKEAALLCFIPTSPNRDENFT